MTKFSPNYFVDIKKIFPKSSTDLINDYSSCVLAINLKSSKFVPDKIEAFSKWIETKFKSCLILISDSLYGLSIQMLDQKLDEQKANLLALSEAEELIKAMSDKFEVRKKCDFEILLCSEIQKYPDYEEYRQNIELYSEQEPKFKSSIQSFAKGFLYSKQIPLSDKFIQMTCDFVIEDLAIFACISQRGYKALIYPGYLPLFIEIVNGEYPQLISQLQNLIYYEMTIKTGV